jgi:hypothetical protein
MKTTETNGEAMTKELVERKFKEIGAKVRFTTMPERIWRPRVPRGTPDGRPPYTIDVVTTKKKREYFEIRLNPTLRRRPEFGVLDARPADRHLLLFVKWSDARMNRRVDRFLCGHDERFWFAAAVPDRPSTVAAAVEALKPRGAHASQKLHGVKAKARNCRKNAGFIRQGEWFFVPEPDIHVPEILVLRHEPIRRGGGKPHIVEFAYRRGGTLVWVCWRYPNGLTDRVYRKLIERDPDKVYLPWTQMLRDVTTYAKGRVTHPDHKTAVLPSWHRVLPNREEEVPARRESLVFLD